MCRTEGCSFQVCPHEVGSLEVRRDEPSALKVCLHDIGVLQAPSGEAGTL